MTFSANERVRLTCDVTYNPMGGVEVTLPEGLEFNVIEVKDQSVVVRSVYGDLFFCPSDKLESLDASPLSSEPPSSRFTLIE
jgi:hypothetical protein